MEMHSCSCSDTGRYPVLLSRITNILTLLLLLLYVVCGVQLLMANSIVYEETDVGHNIFFIQSGVVEVHATTCKENLDYNSSLCNMLLHRKHIMLGGVFVRADHARGAHFGEFCLTSKAGLRLGTATVVVTAAVYDISKSDLWSVLLTMPLDARCKCLGDLFCSVGGIAHTDHGDVVEDLHNSELIHQTSISGMFKLSAAVVEAAVKTFAPVDDEGFVAGIDKRTLIRRKASVSTLESHDTKMSASSRLLPVNTRSKWTAALQAYHENCATFTTPPSAVIRERSRKLIDSTVKGVIEEGESSCSERDIDDRDIMDDVEEMVESMFAKFDLDGSGTLDRTELMSSLTRLGVVLEWDEIDSMIATATSTTNDVVSQAEVVNAVVNEITVLHNRRTSLAALSPRHIPSRAASQLTDVAETILEADCPSDVM